MAYQLIWTAEADNDFKKIVLYLKETWSLHPAEKFVDAVYKKLESYLPCQRLDGQQLKLPFTFLNWTKKMFYSFR